MDKIVDIYLSEKKMHFLSHFLYLLMCVLLENKILNFMGIYYTFPKEINTAIILTFILNGQIILPIILFVLISTLFHLIKNGAYYLIYLKQRKKIFKDIKGFILYTGQKRNWFVCENDIYIKGYNFQSFISLLDEFDNQNQSNIVELASLINSIVLSIIFTILFYDIPYKYVLLIISIFYYLFNTYNLFFLYKIQDSVFYFKSFKEKILSEIG